MHSFALALAQAMAAMEIMQADLNALARVQTSERSGKQGARRSLPASMQVLSHELREDPPSPIHHRNILPVNDVTASWKSGNTSQAADNMAELDQVQEDISKIVLENDRCVLASERPSSPALGPAPPNNLGDARG